MNKKPQTVQPKQEIREKVLLSNRKSQKEVNQWELNMSMKA